MPTDTISRIRDDILAWLSRPAPKRGAQALEPIRAAIGTSTSPVRDENQDCAAAVHYNGGSTTPPLRSFILCDGIGGMRDGGTCARLATATFIASLLGRKFERAHQRALTAARAANDEVFAHYGERGGTTLSAIVMQENDDCGAISVGDSRIYEVVGSQLNQVTIDDTLANEIQHLKPADSKYRSRDFGKQLTQFIGLGKDVQFRPIELRKSNNSKSSKFLLTSDGIHTVNADTLRDVASSASTYFETVQRLTAIARWGKSNDDASVICAENAFEVFPSPNHLQIWDSHSSLHILSDALVWYKEKRPRKAAEKRTRGKRNARHRQSDSRSNVRQRSSKTDKGEPLQLEILTNPNDKAAD